MLKRTTNQPICTYITYINWTRFHDSTILSISRHNSIVFSKSFVLTFSVETFRRSVERLLIPLLHYGSMKYFVLLFKCISKLCKFYNNGNSRNGTPLFCVCMFSKVDAVVTLAYDYFKSVNVKCLCNIIYCC